MSTATAIGRATTMTIERLAVKKLQVPLLRWWHAWIAGGFLVAYLTADEDTYAMHLFAGYAVLVAVVVRLVVGLTATRAPLRLGWPSVSATRAWLAGQGGRNPLYAWLGVAVLLGVGLSAASGALADPWHSLEDLHEALSEAALWPIFGHIAFILFIYGGRRLFSRHVKDAT